jgi:hypothetical protein
MYRTVAKWALSESSREFDVTGKESKRSAWRGCQMNSLVQKSKKE